MIQIISPQKQTNSDANFLRRPTLVPLTFVNTAT